MEYHPDGKMKQPVPSRYPLKMYKKGGYIVMAKNAEEEEQLKAAGASTKIHDREVHK